MGHDRRITSIQSAVARLTALAGAEPRVTEETGEVRIEIDVTLNATEQWGSILEVLRQGTAFGLTATATGQVAWLRLESEEHTDS
ncbi:hypothetical protein QQM39_18965 [Streptomyces sp. DT2A-34]|uniref:hypothetical protein n=1 Tax=Streptomyces sp. DT2A-34 TaxID=3051182 RepID=UPI00265C73FC|nr:hypothetical protein [Streptomyces sp. DT2A-34]MDO0912847.1 hypothetical protein [Streptomyces sp. DT2A-34]